MNSGAAQTRKRGVERKKSWFRAYIIRRRRRSGAEGRPRPSRPSARGARRFHPSICQLSALGGEIGLPCGHSTSRRSPPNDAAPPGPSSSIKRLLRLGEDALNGHCRRRITVGCGQLVIPYSGSGRVGARSASFHRSISSMPQARLELFRRPRVDFNPSYRRRHRRKQVPRPELDSSDDDWRGSLR